MSTYLITGAARGLGLALVSQLSRLEVKTVFAASREKEPASLKDLVAASAGRVVPIQMDPNSPDSIKKAVQSVQGRLEGQGLDFLINNAGVILPVKGGIADMEPEQFKEAFNVNVLTAHMVTSAFIPLLRAGQRKTVVNISTTVGSFGKSQVFASFRCPSYKITKAAMNMMTVQYAYDYAADGFTCFAISPGWLRTDGGGPTADLPAETGAEAVIKIVQGSSQEQNGRFYNIHVPGWEKNPGLNQYDGEEIPW